MKRHPIVLFSILTSLSLGARTALARWTEPDEATLSLIEDNTEFHVAADGTFITSGGDVMRIDKEAARGQGMKKIHYNEDSTRLVKFEGWTINGNNQLAVDPQKIERQAVAGGLDGFDRIQQITVPFPEITVGSKMKTVLAFEHFVVPVPGFFAMSFSFGEGTPEENSSVKIVSELPLVYVLKGAEGYLKVEEGREGKQHILTVKTLKKAFFEPFNEQNPWFLDPVYPRIFVSSSADWSLIQRSLAAGYEKVLAEPLPAVLQPKVVEIRQMNGSMTDKANQIMAYMAENIRYMGDWRTVKGGFQPRPFTEIEKTRFGDCKDYSAMLTKALREMGYTAHPAIVWRGATPLEKHPLPDLNFANHAIVMAEDKDQKVYWIDPTNHNAYAQAVRADIAGRPALVLFNDSRDGAREIPRIVARENATHSWSTLTPIDSTTLNHKIKYEFTGLSATRIAGQTLNMTDKEFEEKFIRDHVSTTRIVSSDFHKPDLKSRVVKDLTIEASVTARWLPRRTSAGYAHAISASFEELQKLDLANRVSDFYLGDPRYHTSTKTLKNVKFVGKQIKECTLTSKWLALNRTARQVGEDIEVNTSTEVLQPYITLSELKSADGTALRKQLRKCFHHISIIYNPVRPWKVMDRFDANEPEVL